MQAGKLLDRAKYGVAYVSNVLLKLNLKLGGQNVHPSPMGCSLVQAAAHMLQPATPRPRPATPPVIGTLALTLTLTLTLTLALPLTYP